MSIRKVALASVALGLAGLLVMHLKFDNEAQRVNRVLERTRQGINHRSIRQVMSNIDHSYEDVFGHDYAGLRRRFETEFSRHDVLECSFLSRRVSVRENTAVCSLAFRLVAYDRPSPGDEAYPEDLSIYRDELVVQLRKSETGWRIIGAGPVSEELPRESFSVWPDNSL
ncbi:MAG: hypothetical protein ABIK62_06930 [candidate division WOR-3 bacterium]